MVGLTKAFQKLILAMLVTLVVWPLVASPVHHDRIAASPRDAHPLITQEVAREAYLPPPAGLQPAPSTRLAAFHQATGGPSREVFGFVRAATIGYGDIGYTTWDFSMLSTVAYFGLHVNWDGNILSNNAWWTIWNSSTVTNLVNAAHNQGVKVVLTLILGDTSPNSPAMCSALGWGDRTISQAVQEVAAKGIDGINIDYEGNNDVCVNGQTTQAMFITFVQRMRAALPAGSYLSIDTYSGSAAGTDGFFNIPALAPYTDSFFVMAYDMEYYNWAYPPLNCSRMCLGPTAPLTTYYYNDTRTAAEYTAVVSPSKVLLGVPYYGRKACVARGGANDYPTSSVVADTYLDAAGEASWYETAPGTYSIHRDPHDLLGQERFDDWLNTTLNCTRQLYWDDFVSLGAKYDLINRYNLQGVGIFTLDYGGGAPELWCDLRDHFSPGHVPATASVDASQSTTRFTVSFTAGQGCGVSSFDLQQRDTTRDQDWVDIARAMRPTSYVDQAYSGTLVANGYVGHSYEFRVRTHDGHGYVGAWSPPVATTVPTTATLAHPFQGLYTLDAFGGVDPDDSPPVPITDYWPGWKIARAAHALPGRNDPQSGAVLDGYGGLHSYGATSLFDSPAYWHGWDIARDFAFLPDGSGGYVLDGYGGLHPFSVDRFAHRGFAVTPGPPPPAQGAAYWPGRDIARKVVIFDDGKGGYVLDGYGGIHAFGIGQPAPPNPRWSGYWSGWDIAHDIVLIPGTHSGYVMDGYGGMHGFAPPGQPLPAAFQGGPYWRGWDIARAIWLLPSSTLTQPAGYLLDGYGGLHPLGLAPVVSPTPYWQGRDIARDLWGA